MEIELEGFQGLRQDICSIVKTRTVAYYGNEDLNPADTATVFATFANAMDLADAGALGSAYLEVSQITSTALKPQILLDSILSELSEGLKKYPSK